jgi:hypothetical protein
MLTWVTKGRDCDHSAFKREHWAPGIAGVYEGVRQDRTRAQIRNHAARHRKGLAKREAKRNDPVTRTNLYWDIGQREGTPPRHNTRVNPKHGDVGIGIAPDDFNTESCRWFYVDGYLFGRSDHVIVCENEAQRID